MLEKKTRRKPIPMTTSQMKGAQVKRSEMATTIVVAARPILIYDGCSKFISGATISIKMSSNSSSNSQLRGKITTVSTTPPFKDPNKTHLYHHIQFIIHSAQFPLVFFFQFSSQQTMEVQAMFGKSGGNFCLRHPPESHTRFDLR